MKNLYLISYILIILIFINLHSTSAYPEDKWIDTELTLSIENEYIQYLTFNLVKGVTLAINWTSENSSPVTTSIQLPSGVVEFYGPYAGQNFSRNINANGTYFVYFEVEPEYWNNVEAAVLVSITYNLNKYNYQGPTTEVSTSETTQLSTPQNVNNDNIANTGLFNLFSFVLVGAMGFIAYQNKDKLQQYLNNVMNNQSISKIEDVPQNKQMKFCSKCGAPKSGNFCSKCGN